MVVVGNDATASFESGGRYDAIRDWDVPMSALHDARLTGDLRPQRDDVQPGLRHRPDPCERLPATRLYAKEVRHLGNDDRRNQSSPLTA